MISSTTLVRAGGLTMVLGGSASLYVIGVPPLAVAMAGSASALGGTLFGLATAAEANRE